MNAPTGRNASVSVMDKATAASDRWNSRAIAVSVMTTRKKSKASSVQPRKPARTAARWSSVEAEGRRGIAAANIPQKREARSGERASSLAAGWPLDAECLGRLGLRHRLLLLTAHRWLQGGGSE